MPGLFIYSGGKRGGELFRVAESGHIFTYIYIYIHIYIEAPAEPGERIVKSPLQRTLTAQTES